MTTLKDVAFVCKLLNEEGARYLVVGAHALSLHGVIRATKDVDIFVPKDLENFERVLEGLRGLLWGLAGEISAEDAVRKPFTIIGDQPRVDILTVAQGLSFEVAHARGCESQIDGVRVPYISFEDLMHMKHTPRLQDQADLLQLQRIKDLRENGQGP